MNGLRDIINFLIPIPPAILVRKGELPNCTDIFEQISNSPPNPRPLGRLFSWLCSISFLSWIVFSVNGIIFSACIILALRNWGNNIPLSDPYYFDIYSCQMILSILASLLFFGQLSFYIIGIIASQVSDRCLEHATCQIPDKIKKNQ